jgi:hypothetical protein
VVTFELFEEGEKTRLKLTQRGLKAFPEDRTTFDKKNFAAGRTFIIGRPTKEFLEQSNNH